MKPEKFDFEDFVRQAGDQLRSGKPLTGADGVFTPLLKRILEASLEGELYNQLQETRSKDKNNGYSAKNLSRSLGSLEIFAPRDRNASFEPQIIEKRQRSLSENIDKKILSLYGLGMSYADIQGHLKELRRILYTTNPIESYHRMVRKVTKTKGAFSSEDASVKQIYLATVNANTKWQGQMFGWPTVRNELYQYFGDRL